MVAKNLVKVRPEEDGVHTLAAESHLRSIDPPSSRGDWGGKALQCLLTVLYCCLGARHVLRMSVMMLDHG